MILTHRACRRPRYNRFGSPYLAVCAAKRIGESILVALVAAIQTGEVFFDNHFK